MNIITRKAYNTIMVDGLGSTRRNLVAIVKDVHLFVESFTYIIDFVVLEDIGEFIVSDMTAVMMGKPFRKVTKLEYDCTKGLISFTRIFDNYTFQMPRTIPRFKSWGYVSWSKITPILVLSQRDLINGFRNSYEKNKLMYKNCLNLGPEYQVDESMKEWLIRGHVSLHEVIIWMAFRGNTRDLRSIGEETDKTTTLDRSLLKNYVQCLEKASQFLATPSYLTSDGVRTLTMASERSCLKRNPRRFDEATASETL
ncbi:hypothetical protein Tco_0344898 [Tanacetum coccineum]